MYERSAIVLERYLSKIFGQENDTSIKASYQIYKDILEEMEKYQVITEEEEKVINEFDEIAKKMQSIQKKQETLCSDSIEQEEERNKLFNDFEQDPSLIERKLLKIEKVIEENAKEQEELREEYIELLNEFAEKQKERNRCGKNRRAVETNHVNLLNETIEKTETIDSLTIKNVKEFIAIENDELCQAVNKIMLENGKNEKIKFDVNVIKKAVQTRIKIAKEEATCYVNCYEKLKKLIAEIEGDNLKLGKYQKALKETTVKLKFFEAEKEYIVNFLDNERMTAINGEETHKQMMQEACKNFDMDIIQIDNLYNLMLREMAGRSTKKAYKELYNSTYLEDIEETEKTFNQEINNIRANIGTIINKNYWRIEGIKNIYKVFNKEVEEEFKRDLSGFRSEEKGKIEYAESEKDFIENDDEIEENDTEEWFISNSEINININNKYEQCNQYEEDDKYEQYDEYDEYSEYGQDDEYEEESEYGQDDDYDEDSEYTQDDEDEEYENEEKYDDELDDNYEEDDEIYNDYENNQTKEKRNKVKNKTKKQQEEIKKSSIFEKIFKENKN